MATRVVGLDLGTHTVKACELVTTFRNFELTGFATEPVEADPGQRPTLDQIAQAAARLLERRGLKEETLMCALPADYVSTVSLEFPFNQPKKIEQVLPFQVEEIIPFDIEDVVHDYQIVQNDTETGACRVVVAYVKRELLEQFISTLNEHGVDPKVVSLGGMVYYNLYDVVIGEGMTAPVAILDLGHAHSELTIFDGGMPVAVRIVPGGGLDVTNALAAGFHVSPEEAEEGKLREGFVDSGGGDTQVDYSVEHGESRRALIGRICRKAITPVIREVRRSLLAHFEETGHGIARLYVTGGGSRLQGLTDLLAHNLGVPVERLAPLEVPFNRLPPAGEEVNAYAGKALAVSLRAFNRAHQSQINFRKGQYVYTGDFGFLRGRMISLAASVALIVVLAAAVAITKKRLLEAERLTLAAEVKAISTAVVGQETEDAERVLALMNAAEQSETRLIPEISAFEIFFELSSRIGSDITVDVDRMTIDIDNKRVEVDGKTGSGGDVERIVESMESYRCLKNRVNKERVEKAVDDRTKFQLRANSGC